MSYDLTDTDGVVLRRGASAAGKLINILGTLVKAAVSPGQPVWYCLIPTRNVTMVCASFHANQSAAETPLSQSLTRTAVRCGFRRRQPVAKAIANAAEEEAAEVAAEPAPLNEAGPAVPVGGNDSENESDDPAADPTDFYDLA